MNDSQSNILQSPTGLNNQGAQQSLFNNPDLNALLAKVQSGQVSIQDALSQSGKLGPSEAQRQQARQATWDGSMQKYGGNGEAIANATNSEYNTKTDPGFLRTEFMRQLATNPVTGGKLASYGVQNDPLLQGGLDTEKGQLQQGQSLFGNQSGILDKLQNQGYQLKPEDQSLYGQASGNIARQFGQQGNKASANLAMRGLSNSGAAGATFSGLAGNQNEMLAQAQQQIMQQRFQNTMQQVGQQQQFMNQLNSQNNQMAGKYADTAGQYQGQEYNQNLAGIENQQKQSNDQFKNSSDWQSLNQNEGNEQFGQRQATGLGATIGQAAGAFGTIAKGVGALTGLGGGK